MDRSEPLRRTLLLLSAAAFLASCQSSNNPGAAPVVNVPKTYRISGIAAYGQPVAGKTVQALDSAGTRCASATTASDGSYSMDTTSCMPGSAAVSLEGYTTPNGAPLLSVAVPPEGGTVIDGMVNVDPLTTLLAYDAAGMVSASSAPANSGDVLALLPHITAAQLEQATTHVLTASLLQTLQRDYGVAMTGFSPMSTPFTADGQGLDGFFDAYPLTAPTATSVEMAESSGGLVLKVTVPTVAGGGSSVTSSVSYTVSGRVSGLSGGSVTLLLNGVNALSIVDDGAFTFPESISSTYAVTVRTQPTGQICTVSDGVGSGVTTSVSSVRIVCSAVTQTISGIVTGLAGEQLTLDNNGADPVAITADGGFTFTTPVAYGGSYAVTVATQPVGEVCTVANGSGTGVTADISTVRIVCSSLRYTIGGSVAGLAGGAQVTLDDNGANPVSVTANGSFVFRTPVAYGGSYAVTVGAEPTGQVCTVSNSSGAGVTANVATVQVVCSTLTYTIGGNVSGLADGTQVTLDDNGSNPLTVTANAAFRFTTPVAYGGSYAVTVGTQPTGQVCTVSNATGAGVTASVSTVNIVCSTSTYIIGGSVTGLAGSTQVTLDDNGADPVTVMANGAFTFATPVAYAGSYAVTVGTQPTGQICTVSNGTGTGVTASVATVSIVCSTVTFTIGGTVTGLAGGAQVTLRDNGADPVTVTANGAFTFPTPVAYGGSYTATVGTQPNGQTCSVSNGAGTGITSDVATVAISCTDSVVFIYVPNYGSNDVLGYQFDLTTGNSSSIPGSPFHSGTNDRWVTTNTAGTFAYVTNEGSNNMSAYTIDHSTGALTPVAGSPFATGTTPISVTLNPAGTFAYVANANGAAVSGFSVDQTTGGLTAISGSPFATGNNPQKIAVNPAGTFAFVTNVGDNTISVFSIDPSTGALTPISGSPFTNGNGNSPAGITVNPAGTVVYVTNSQANIMAFSIDAATGALAPVAGSPFTSNYGGWGWQSLAVNPAGTLAVASTGNGGHLLTFSIDPSTGALTQLPADAYGAYGYGGSNYAVFNQAGTQAFVSNAWGLWVSVVSVDSTTGALTDVSGSPFGVGARPFDIAVVQRQ